MNGKQIGKRVGTLLFWWTLFGVVFVALCVSVFWWIFSIIAAGIDGGMIILPTQIFRELTNLI